MSFKACKILIPALSGLAALAFALSAGAHGSMKPEHGGLVQMTGETLFELVSAPAGVALYVKEDEEVADRAGRTHAHEPKRVRRPRPQGRPRHFQSARVTARGGPSGP